MLYVLRLCGYAPYAHGLLSCPTEWIILRMARKRKLTNCLSYLEHWIDFHIIYEGPEKMIRGGEWVPIKILHRNLYPKINPMTLSSNTAKTT
jgi:hypothetical protein